MQKRTSDKYIKRPRAILMDIEGTTSSSAFFSEILFPYSRSRLRSYCVAHPEKTATILSDVQAMEPNADPIMTLEQWIDENQKIAPLKILQGMIWSEAFYNGKFKGHVYTDVLMAFERWHANDIELYIFSSASVEAQKLLFGFSEVGDLTRILSGYFDTSVGSKRESESYELISKNIGWNTEEILFLSDTPEEVDAARKAGLIALCINRADGISDISSFNDIEIIL